MFNKNMRKSYRTTYLLILLAILFSYVFWVIDSLYVYEMYQQCATDALLDNIPAHSYFARVVVVVFSLLSAFLISYYYHGSEKVKYSLLRTVEIYQTTLSVINDGLFDYDLENDRVYFSDSFYKMLGYAPGEFPQNNKEFEKRIHSDDREKTILKMAGFLKIAEPFEIEFRMIRKDGSFSWLKGRGTTAQKDLYGKPVRIVGTYTDISILKSKEIEFYDNR